jgi:hypothetical protein
VVNLAFFVLFTTKHTEVYTETTKGFLTTILCALRGFFVLSVVNLSFFVLFTTKHTEVYTETTKGFHTTILWALCVFFVLSVVNLVFFVLILSFLPQSTQRFTQRPPRVFTLPLFVLSVSSLCSPWLILSFLC